MDIYTNTYQQGAIYNQYGRPVERDISHRSGGTSSKDAAEVKDRISIDTSSRATDRGKSDREREQRIQQEVQRLRAIEEKVKAHEQAHKSAGGQFTGAVSYSYTTGPDGKRYITGGEVAIQIVEGKTPEETIRNMEIVRRAALAPADPSPQDRAVAAQASQIQQRARSEQAKSKAEESNEDKAETANNNNGANQLDGARGSGVSNGEIVSTNANSSDYNEKPPANRQPSNNAAIKAYRAVSSIFSEAGLSIFA